MGEEIKPGDVVVLKSGSLPMTVTAVDDHYGVMSAWVVWSDEKRNHQNATYDVVALKKAD